MLNIGDMTNAPEMLVNLVKEFRRVQVSRFPIDVRYAPNTGAIVFVDSRFPSDSTNYHKIVGLLFERLDDKGKNIYDITSRLISNSKFNPGKAEHHTKTTNDVKKAIKFMRDYLKPFSQIELANRSVGYVTDKFNEQKMEIRSAFFDVCQIGVEALIQEVIRLKAIGVKPQTEKFEKLYSEGIGMYEAYLESKQKKFNQAHVFINPDDSVLFTLMEDVRVTKPTTASYESLTECPDWVQQGVAMLRMLEATKKPVVGLGTRWGDRDFWIEVPA
jgi:hypothetical protein